MLPEFAIEFLKGYGGPGAVIFALVASILALYKRLDRATEARIKDWAEQADIAKNDASVLSTLSASTDARNRASESMARSLELSAASNAVVASNVTALASDVRDLRSEFLRLRDDVLRLRGGAA